MNSIGAFQFTRSVGYQSRSIYVFKTVHWSGNVCQHVAFLENCYHKFLFCVLSLFQFHHCVVQLSNTKHNNYVCIFLID